jgi:cytochrome c
VLKQHAIEGFTGVGFMPAKGGRLDLSDEEVAVAVDYMVGESS